MKRLAMSMLGLAAFTLVAVRPAVAKDAAAQKAGDAWSAAAAALPANTMVVMGISATKIRSLAVFQDAWKQVAQMPDVAQGLGLVKQACGIDALQVIEAVVIGVDEKENAGIFIQLNGLDQDKLTTCFSTIGQQMAGKKLTAKKTGNLTEYSMEGENEKIYVAWPASNVVFFSSKPTDKAATQKWLSGKGKLGKDANFKAGLGLVKTGSLFWLVSSKMNDADLKKAKAKFGAFQVDTADGTNLSIDGRLRVGDAKTATNMATELQQKFADGVKQLPANLQALVKNITIGSSDKDVTVTGSVKLDAATVKMLTDMAKGM